METITIIELQSYADGRVLIPTPIEQRTIRPGEAGAQDEMEALSLFHTKCSYACISACDVHTVMAVDAMGNVWHKCKETFFHGHSLDE